MGDAPATLHGRLRVNGALLVDRTGQPVTLRGVSLHWSQWMPQFFNRSVMQWLLDDWEIDVIRVPLGVHHDGFLEHPERELSKIRHAVDAAIECGLYVILDWHTHELDVAESRTYFALMAEYYGTFDNVIYETWNEPHGSYSWKRDIKPYHEEVTTLIWAYAPNSLIVAGTQRWCHDVECVISDRLCDDNTMYSLHFYSATHGAKLRSAAERAIGSGIPLFVTEWSVSEASGGGRVDIDDTVRWLNFLNQKHISYVNWSISNLSESSAALLPGAMFDGTQNEQILSQSGRFVRDHLREMRLQKLRVRP